MVGIANRSVQKLEGSGTAELVSQSAPDFLKDARFLLKQLETRNLD